MWQCRHSVQLNLENMKLTVVTSKRLANQLSRCRYLCLVLVVCQPTYMNLCILIWRLHLTFVLFPYVLITLICFATDLPTCKRHFHFWLFLFSIHTLRRLLSVRHVSQDPYCLMYILMPSSIPIVPAIVSYLQMMFIPLMMLRTVNSCDSMLRFLKVGLGQCFETEGTQNHVYNSYSQNKP